MPSATLGLAVAVEARSPAQIKGVSASIWWRASAKCSSRRSSFLWGPSMNRKVGPPVMLNELKIVRNRMICNRRADLGAQVIGSLGQVTNAPTTAPQLPTLYSALLGGPFHWRGCSRGRRCKRAEQKIGPIMRGVRLALAAVAPYQAMQITGKDMRNDAA